MPAKPYPRRVAPGIYERAPGHYSYLVTLPPGSKKRQDLVSGFTTKEEAVAARAARMAQLASGQTNNPTSDTLLAYLRGWLARKRGIADGTWLNYQTAIERHIGPAIGSIKLRRLTAEQVEAFYVKLADTYPGALPNVRVVMGQALDQAVVYRHVAVNVARLVSVRGTPQARYPVWTLDEARRFLSGIGDDTYGPLLRFLLATGCRFGEAAALAWGDVDLAAGRVTIRRTRTVNRQGQAVIGERPKTGAGVRTFQLNAGIVELLKERKAAATGTLVFGRYDGRMPAEATVREHFRALCASADVPRIRLHDLRHTHATLVLSAGEDIHVLSKRLGHRSIKTTLDLYAKLTDDQQERAADRVERLFG